MVTIPMRRRPLVWLNVVCLDAPLVACVWQWFFARNLQVTILIGSQVALFLTAWLIYLIDRFADSISLPTNSEKSLREAFCLRHKNVWIVLIPTIALSDAVFVFWRLDHEVFAAGIFLGAVAMIYLAINFVFSKLWAAIPIKEIVIGLLFAAGTLLAPMAQLSPARSTITRLDASFAAVLFACLCSLNCMSIAVWERNLDRVQRKHSIATRWVHAKPLVRVLGVTVTVSSVVFGIIEMPLRPLADCLVLSTIALLVLHFVRVAADERAALADLVLLTPLAWLLVRSIK